MAYRRTKSSSHLLNLHHISIDHNSNSVLHDLTFSISKGEFHAIIGEPKSGLSSLARLIRGIIQPSAGTIEFENRTVSPLSVDSASQLGIALVTEDSPFNEALSVVDNIVVVNPMLNKRLFINEYKARRLAEDLLVQNGFQHIDPAMPVHKLKLADRISIYVLHKVIAEPKLLIIDETIERLSGLDLLRIVGILKRVCQEGNAVLYLTHSIEAVFRFIGRASILHEGQIIFSDKIHDLSRINLIQLAYAHNIMQKDLIADAEFYNILKFNDAILYQLPVNLVVVDRHKRVKILNAFAMKHLLASKSDSPEFINTRIEDLFPKEADKMQEIFAELPIKRQRIFERIPVIIDGQQHHFIVLVSPVLDETSLIGNVIILEDITTEILLQQRAILAEKLYTTGLLATGVAHEINNPLATISNYLEYLRPRLRQDKDRKIFDRIDSQLANVASIVGNLLSLSPSSQIQIEETELNLLSSQVIDLLQFSAGQNKARISLIPEKESIFVLINRVEYQQILTNLVRNSLEAMPDGGLITVKIEKIHGSDCVAITVRDAGPGIQEGILDNIFMPFVTTRDSGTNTGLGLAITHTLVTKYGGNIAARNCPDGGAEFKVMLPLS